MMLLMILLLPKLHATNEIKYLYNIRSHSLRLTCKIIIIVIIVIIIIIVIIVVVIIVKFTCGFLHVTLYPCARSWGSNPLLSMNR